MKLQSINQNNYQSNNPNFKMNLLAKTNATCPAGVFKQCETLLGALCKESGIQQGRIERGNAGDAIVSFFDGLYHILIPDAKTGLPAKLSQLDLKSDAGRRTAIQLAQTDPETVPLTIPEKIGSETDCPFAIGRAFAGVLELFHIKLRNP